MSEATMEAWLRVRRAFCGHTSPARPVGVSVASLAAALLCVATLMLLAVPASAQRSRGNFFVYQSTNCTGLAERSNDPTVSVPFSVGGRNYPANIELHLFAST